MPLSAIKLAEQQRLAEDARREKNWKRWGPYLSERQWGTVREDYSANGECWDYFTHEDAVSRAYRWGEDGLLGLCDREGRLCFAWAFWNEQDPILKERLFGLSGPEGNHGEDAKECYYYLDSTPTHSYAKALYKYPQSAFPYDLLRSENRRRGREEPEYEILDTPAFNDGRYFDAQVEYAKAGPEDVLITLTVFNRGPDPARIHVLPTLWFRNSWSWGNKIESEDGRPSLHKIAEGCIDVRHATLGSHVLQAEPLEDAAPPEMLFTENETNAAKLFGAQNRTPYVKDAFHRYVISGDRDAVNPGGFGTKAAFHYAFEVPPSGQKRIRLRLSATEARPATPFGREFESVLNRRIHEADEFYTQLFARGCGPHAAGKPLVGTPGQVISRQAYAGLLWSKQFYHYDVQQWLTGDPAQPVPPPEHAVLRNADWTNLYCRDVLSMPDKWEYPWFAAWDLAFHMIPMARLDSGFAKDQLNLLLREWYMNPNGQIPAYEWNFSDVNPPVHAWACWRVYKMTGGRGERDRAFLARTFQKLLLNFTWWVNRKDPEGRNIFAGGFLGLDNIGVFDRSRPLPDGYVLSQADGTAWMAFYCTTMLAMALELARHDEVYEDIASKFFEHFVGIANAINTLGGTGLWDEQDGFYYDRLLRGDERSPVRLRSAVGLIPLFAAEFLEADHLAHAKGFSKRMKWFMDKHPDLAKKISYLARGSASPGGYLLAIPSRERLERVLSYVFDEKEFLSPYGIRSLSRVYQEKPYTLQMSGNDYRVHYVPGDSDSGLFGGNSNWRGPIWFPLNYLLIESLERYHHFYGDSFKVEFPTGSGNWITLRDAARELSARLTRLFLPNTDGRRPCNGLEPRYVQDPHWHDLVLFHEYFHGETGKGLGASHQTGWTTLVTELFDNAR
ncbi:MAG TPA: hypothetical protein VFT72_02140 [Opitutaceae bacterium]|nr:hypothetical protein [Opitutaceae bacterium]